MRIIKKEKPSLFLKRRIPQIDDLVDNALERINPQEFILNDYIDEIAWQVADEFQRNDKVNDIIPYVKEKYKKHITSYYNEFFN